MADDRRALGAAGPILTGLVLARRKRLAVRRRAGQRVVLVRGVAAAVDHLALLSQIGLLGQIVGAVQFIDILGDDDAFSVLPRPLADAVARIDRRLTIGGLGAEISAPCLVGGADRDCQQLAQAAGPGDQTWRAYLSTQAAD